MIVNIQGSDETIYSVNLGIGSCSCGHKMCEHLIRANDIYLNSGKRFRFEVVSAAHKCARTSDIRATWPWIQTYAQISGGMNRVATYMRKIVFEESRSISLWEKFRNRELSPEQEVRSLILVRKKWERLPNFRGHMNDWINSFKVYQSEKDSWDERRMRHVLRKFQDAETGYQVLHYLKDNKKLKPVFWQEVGERAERERNDKLKRFLRYEPSTSYERMCSLEITLQLYGEEADEMHAGHEVKCDFVPTFRDHFLDVHCWDGRRNFIKYFPGLMSGQLPPESGLNLILSGQIFGVAARFSAFNQQGALTTKNGGLLPWKNIRMEQKMEDIAWLDSSYYSKIYDSLAKKGHWKIPLVIQEPAPAIHL